MSDTTPQIPFIGGAVPDPDGPITGPNQLAYVLSEQLDDLAPLNIRRYLWVAEHIWSRIHD